MSGRFWIDAALIDDRRYAAIGLAASKVLIILIRHADKHGDCWPSVTRIAELTGVSRRTVCSSILELEQSGIVTCRRAAGRRTEYLIRTSEVTSPVSDGTSEVTSPVTGEVTSHTGEVTSHTGEVTSPEGIQRRNTKKEEKKEAASGKQKKQVSKPAKYDPLSAPLPFTSDAFLEAWQMFVANRESIGKPLTEPATKTALGKLRRWGERGAIASLENSVIGGYQGVFEVEPPPMTEAEIGDEASRQIFQIAAEQGSAP